MADRYWVGGTGTWNTSSTTNWSASPGGASGASVPTAADSVFFDQAGTYTVTLTGALTCLSFNVSAGAVTFTSTGTLAVSGNMSITNVTPTWSATGTITFGGSTSRTITTNGTSFACAMTFNGFTTWTLGSSLTTAGINVFIGTLNTSAVGNYSITTPTLTVTSTTSTFLTLNASTVTLTSTTPLTVGASSTINAGTSQINCTASSSMTFAGGGKTFYNVAFTSTATNDTTVSITGANTFNNLSMSGHNASTGYRTMTFSANQTINGTLSNPTASEAAFRRVLFTSATVGLQYNLTINSAPSLTDADFRDLIVTGTASPISGTRIGDLRGCSGITFSTPKTVYWNLPAGGNWSATAWAPSSGGTAAVNNFPLPQDTAIIENTGLNTSATITINANWNIGTINISGRTTAMTLAFGSTTPTLFGNLTLSASVTRTGSGSITFGGRNTQTITSAGITIGQPIVINSVGGTVVQADGLTTTNTLNLTNGTFDTAGYNLSVFDISGSNSNVRGIRLRNSAVTITGTSIVLSTTTNLTWDAGTSTITTTSTGYNTWQGGGLTYNNFVFNAGPANSMSIPAVTLNNLTLISGGSGTISPLNIGGNITVNGTLTVAGSSAISRNFLRSNVLGTARTLTVNSLSAQDCDFRDIIIAGAAAGSSPTRAGDCGGNSGITFPAAKTVFWNLAGTQDWNATAWAPSSGGTPNINNFPLAQDTAVFNNAGSAGTVSINAAWNIGTFNASARTSAMTFGGGAISAFVHGDWSFGTGINHVGSGGAIIFAGRSTRTITSNGVAFTSPIEISCVTGTVQLADALTISSPIRTFTLTSGTFDAVTYNVTIGIFSGTGTAVRTLRMGTGIWTLSGTGTVWNMTTLTNLTYQPGTSTIVLSDTTTSARTFTGGATLYYNKLTIGGTTGISTLTLSSNSTYGELASTKTVAHTIAFGSTSPTIGLWSITGRAGNVVTVTGTNSINLRGARVSGVNFLALGTTPISTTNPVEFYAGSASTGTGGAINTNAPAAVTRYWVGGTGTWDATTTTNWSDTSGGGGGASVPTSADTVIFDSASNATAYTVTLTATQLRCASLSVSGPASGNVTFAGTAPLSVTQAFTMASTGITRTYTGALTFSGTGTGKTISAGRPLNSSITINGIGAVWALTAALPNSDSGPTFTLTNGSFDTAGFTVTFGQFLETNTQNPITLSFGSSIISTTGPNFTGGSSTRNPVNLTFNAGTSTINYLGLSGSDFYHGGKTFYNFIFTGTVGLGSPSLNRSIFTPTFQNLTIKNPVSSGDPIGDFILSSDVIVNGTFTCVQSPSTTDRRIRILSDTIGTQRTFTAGAVAGLNNIDFQDINCAGAASWTGTSIGDCGGNSGLTASTPKTVYWNLAAGGNWSATAWATLSGGTPAAANFPLPQDTAIIENAGLNNSATITINANWNIGTINTSARTNAMTLTTNSGSPTIYGNLTTGTGTLYAGTGTLNFGGRGTQTVISNGKTLNNNFVINNSTGIVQLGDALDSRTLNLVSGTFDAGPYNILCSGFQSTASSTRTLSMGSGVWSVGSSWNISNTSSLTLNKGTANITSLGTSTVTFTGGGLTYNKLTIGGNTSVVPVNMTDNNTFSEIASTRTVAYQFSLSSSTQRVGAFTVSGSAGNLVTITGSDVNSFATLIYTGAGVVGINHVVPTFLKVYNVSDTWYAGANSTNGGSYGWLFTNAPVPGITLPPGLTIGNGITFSV
jgi:hypothetical protein